MNSHIAIENRLTQLFAEKQNNLLNIYFTAGFPKLNDTLRILQALEKSGVDMIEIGMPFSDPLADGPTIQRSSEIALDNGMSIKVLFEQLKDLRKHVSVPVLLMGYLNPVMQYGIEKFCKKASELGVDGIILPDLPFLEYNLFYKEIFEANQLSNVFLVTPETNAERLKTIDESASGFIYAVSTNSTTGGTKTIDDAKDYFEKLQSAKLKNPIMIGFNINDKKSFQFASQYAHGAIIGSAFVKAISQSNDLENDIMKFVSSIKS
jgi:tryptophan synthase alpha chain